MSLLSLRPMGNGFNEVIRPASNYSDPEQAFRAFIGKDRLKFISVKNVEVCFLNDNLNWNSTTSQFPVRI